MFGSGDRSLAASMGRTISRRRGPCCCVEVVGCGNPICVKMAHKLDMTPNGAWSAWPVAVSTLAWILSLSSVAACTFVTRSVSLKGSEIDDPVADKSLLLLHDHGVGFWGWESEGSCYSYTINGRDPSFDGAYKASNAFTTLTTLLGGIGMMYCWLGTCFLVKPSRYEQIGYLFLLTAVFCASTLVIMASNFCEPGFFGYAVPGTNLKDLMSTSCGMGPGSTLSLIAAIFYATAAIICLRSPLAGKSRTTLREIDPALSKQYQDDGLDDDDEDYDEDRERLRREEETQRRYRDMFGDEEEGEEEDDYYQTDGGKGFQPSLRQVEEEDYDDEEYQSDRGSRRSGRNQFDDERSRGSRSRYSQDSHEAPRSQYARSERSRSHRGGNTSDEQSFYSEDERSQYSREEGSRHSSRRSRRSRDQDERIYEDERSYYSRSQRDPDDEQSFASRSQHSEIV